MLILRARLRRCASLALLAMFALALLPSLAQALQASALPFAGLAICSTSGTLPAGPGAPDGMPPGHCPLCAHAATCAAGMPPAEAHVAITSGNLTPRSSANARQAPQRQGWAAAPARAPPTSAV